MKKATHNRTRKGLVFPPVFKLMGCDIREKMNLAWVTDGKLHGTGSHALFKLDLATWFIPKVELEFLEGKILHRDQLKKMAGKDVRVVTAGIYGIIIEYKNGTNEALQYLGKLTDGTFEISHDDYKNQFNSVLRPYNLDGHIPLRTGDITVGSISFDMNKIEKIADCFNVNDIKEDAGVQTLTLTFPDGWTGYKYDKILVIESGKSGFYLMPVITQNN